MAKIMLLIRIQVLNKNGEIIYDSSEQVSHSFVKQFLHILEAALTSIQTSVKDTSNTSRTIQRPYDTNTIWLSVSNYVQTTYGIVVGTGINAEANTDYALQTIIADGTGAGQMNYQTHTWTTTTVVGANVDFKLGRSFLNNSGASITVNEAGIYVAVYEGVTIRYFCISRDVITPTAVANGSTLNIIFTFRTTV